MKADFREFMKLMGETLEDNMKSGKRNEDREKELGEKNGKSNNHQLP